MLTDREDTGAILVMEYLGLPSKSYANLAEIGQYTRNNFMSFNDSELRKIVNAMIHDGYVEKIFPIRDAEKTDENAYYTLTAKGIEKHKELIAITAKLREERIRRKKRKSIFRRK
jgi:hypothetical protein